MSDCPDLYCCPVCKAPLQRDDSLWRCDNGHSFDIARQGYVNLLLAQHKRSGDPGDNKAMVAARREFLDAGHYRPLLDAVAETLGLCDTGTPDRLQLLDVGCGEGYYTAGLCQVLATRQGQPVCSWGIDISKHAIQAAARRDATIAFAVASSAALPFPDASFDVLVKIYAPTHATELQRVLKPGGQLITVNPGPRHLHQLKAQIYARVQDHDAEVATPAGFHHGQRRQLDYRLTLEDNRDIRNLLAMTPYYWSADRNTQERIAALAELETEVSFLIDSFQVTGQP